MVQSLQGESYLYTQYVCVCGFVHIRKNCLSRQCNHRVSYCGSDPNRPAASQYGVKQGQHTLSGKENKPGYSTPLTYI